jgi:hypothetical protein
VETCGKPAHNDEIATILALHDELAFAGEGKELA